MSKFLDRVKVVASTFVTYAVVAASAFSSAAAALQLSSNPGALKVAGWCVAAATALGSAVNFIRNHTPVPESERGLLPPDPFDWSQ